jgi:hypothetical protein
LIAYWEKCLTLHFLNATARGGPFPALQDAGEEVEPILNEELSARGIPVTVYDLPTLTP